MIKGTLAQVITINCLRVFNSDISFPKKNRAKSDFYSSNFAFIPYSIEILDQPLFIPLKLIFENIL